MKSNRLTIAALLLMTGFVAPLQAATVTPSAQQLNEPTSTLAASKQFRDQDAQREWLYERLEQERQWLERDQRDRDPDSDRDRDDDRSRRDADQRERDRQAEERRRREDEDWQETDRRSAAERDRDRREEAERLEEEREEESERIRERQEEEERRDRDRRQGSDSDRRWEESRRDWLRRQEEARRNWERQQSWENWQRYQDSLQGQWNQWQQSYPSSLVQTTRVELRSLTNDWVTVRIEGLSGDQEISFTGSNSHQSIYLSPGAYRLSFRSTLSSHFWQSGYLNVGRTGTLRIEFDQDDRNVEVYDDPSAWSSGLSFQPY